MVNNFCKIPLWECSRTLSETAMGKVPAETVILNTKLVNVCTAEILEGTDVAVACGRIALVGDAKHCIGKNTRVVDGSGLYLAPAFLDGHIHVESSMLTVGEYAKAVIPHGTSGIFMDPHEICNVLGLDGVRFMLCDAARTPLKTMLTTPSCVPAVAGFEDTGAEIKASDVAETMKWPECVGLGEMMNFPAIIAGDAAAHAIVGETLKSGKIVTGHYSVPEREKGLNAYIAAGCRCCHESTSAEDALAKMRLGMYAQLREGSAWHDLKEVAKAVAGNKADSRFACLVSDDAHPHTLKKYGHLDHIVRRAVEEGIDPIKAIQMVTINTAQCFGLDHELGSIAPSKCADMVLLENLEKCSVKSVFIDGELVAADGKMLKTFSRYKYPEKALKTVHLDKVTRKDFEIPADGKVCEVRVIEIIPAKVGTRERRFKLHCENGLLNSDAERDILKTVVFERHKNTGKIGKGFTKGFGIKNGALAQTVSHDAHNLLVVGTNDEDMAVAANALIECGGGLCAVSDGKVLGLVELPVAGLMSEKPLEEMDKKVAELEEAWRIMGCKHPSPFMTMALIPLACLPELRLTDRGLVDCTRFQSVDLVVK